MWDGAPPHEVLPFLYAAPVVSPVVPASTYLTFRGDPAMVLYRVLMVLPAAILVGWLHAGVMPELILRPEMGMRNPHEHGHGGRASARAGAVLWHAAIDFLDMCRFFLLGAAVSPVFRLLVPARALAPLAGDPILSIAAMIALAVTLSICSEADAFVAASFGFFPPVARLAFMAVGPMVDVKLISLCGSIFRRQTALRLILIPIATVFACAAVGAWLSGARS